MLMDLKRQCPTGLTLAACNGCQTVRLLPAHNFPRSGWWLDCPTCKTYTMFYMLQPDTKPSLRKFGIVAE